MVRTLLISIKDLKNNTIIEDNLEDHILLPNIVNSHIVDLFELLGEDFYNDLMDKVRTETTNANEDKLIDKYLIPFLIQESLYRSIPYMWAKAENSSIILKDGENNKSIDLEQLKYLRADIRNDIGFLKQRVIKYLCENANLYPKYGSVIVPKSGYNNGGIFLGDATKTDCNFYD